MTTTQAATNAAAKLTNERIIQIADETRTAESRDGDYILPISFARAIESAVLASRVPAGLESHVLMPETPTYEMVCAIEAEIDSQLQASGLSAIQMHRQDGADVYAALFAVVERWAASHAVAAAEPAQRDLSLPELAEQFFAVGNLGGSFALSWRECLRLHEAMTTAPAAAPSSADVRAAGWINLKDRKPTDFQPVLVALNTGAIVVGMRGSAGWHWDETDDLADGEATATHWMPLPAAPSTDGEKGEANHG